MKNQKGFSLVELMVVTGILIIIASFALRFIPGNCSRQMILEIGGCDREGRCGVIYANKTKGIEYYPIKGSYGTTCGIN